MAITGLGTEISPFLIETEQDLRDIMGTNKSMNAYYKLTADITMSATSFTPIGSSSNPFTGYFDGAGYKIINLVVNSVNPRTGMFGQVTGSSSKRVFIQNLELVNPKITYTGTSLWTGALAGVINGATTIRNVTVNGGFVSATGGVYTGGLVGSISSATLINVMVKDIDINGSDSVGGISSSLTDVTCTRVLSYPKTLTGMSGRVFGFAYSYSSATFTQCGTTFPPSPSGSYRIHQISVADAKTRNIYTTGNNYNWNNVYWSLGEKEQWDIVEGQYPTITMYGEVSSSPMIISTQSDIALMTANPSNYFKLKNDIAFTGGNSTFIVNVDFKGVLDGDGYTISNIILESPGGDNLAFFSTISGTVKNVGFVFDRIKSNSNAQMICNVLSGTVRGVSGVVTGQFSSGVNYSNNGFIGSIADNAILENCYMQVNTVLSGGYSTYSDFVSIFGKGSLTSGSVKNNIAYIENLSGSGRSAYSLGNGSNPSSTIVSNNVYYIKSGTITSVSGTTRASTLTDFQNPNSTLYSNFDKTNIWSMKSGSNPMLKIFIKILNKIESRLIKSNSRIMKSKDLRYIKKIKNVLSSVRRTLSKNKRFVDVLKKVKSFSGKLSGKSSTTKRLRKRLLKALSFSRRINAKVSKKKKSNKKIKGFTRTMKSRSLRNVIRRTLKVIKSYTRRVTANTLRRKRFIKVKKSFVRRFNSKVMKFKKVKLVRTSRANAFTSKVVRYKGVIRKVKGHSRKITAKSVRSFVRRFIRKVKSFSKPIVSNAVKFSNIYKFIIVTVNSGVNAIVSNVGRRVAVHKALKSYTKKFVSTAKMFYKIASPKEVFAIISHKFSKMSIFKRENKSSANKKTNKTKINMKDNGGDD